MTKIPRLPVLPLVLLALLAAAPAPAWSLFGSSAEEKLLRRADEAYDAAMKAAEEKDALAELQLLSSARSGYQRLADEYPSFRADHVSQRLNAVVMLAESVSVAIDSGESAIADPAAGGARAAEPGAPMAAPDSSDPGAPAFRYPVPALVRTEGAPAAAPERPAPAPAPEETDPSLTAAIPNPFFRKAPEPAAAPEAAAVPPGPEPDAAEGASASVEVTLHEAAPPPPVPPEEDIRDARTFLDMLREARATDAVLLLEDRLEEQGSSASLRTRLMYARALVQCANYRRAADVLAALPKEAEGDPSVRSLRAAVAVGNDDLPEALLQLSLLLRDHAGYADAYVDLAYVYLLLDPVNNRELALGNYKAGLERGAKRDGRLEKELDVTIAR